MPNANSTKIDFNGISNWNKERVSQNSLKTILQNSGNSFQFSFDDEQTADVHVYFSYDTENQELSFQVIKASQDTKENTQAVAIGNVGNTMHYLPSPAETNDTNPHSIDYTTASQRVNDYMNATKRDAWISHLFSKSLEVVQVFVIDAIDFEPGSTYDCFLGLKDEENGTQKIDMMVYNSSESVLVGMRDISLPVPPFKPSGATDKAKFGALVNI